VAAHELKAYFAGIMRHVVIREGKNQLNTIINILTSDKNRFPIEEFWNQFKGVADGVSWSINLSPADRSYGEIQKILGEDHLVESLGKIKFNIPPQSFFQTNTHQAEKLLKVIREFADLAGSENVLDLYSGTGSIGLSLADSVKMVTGIEENEAAVELSKANAKLNGITNYAAFAGRAEDILATFTGQFDLVVVDPPRPGLHKKVTKKLGEMKAKKIIYVSCNPVTQQFDVNLIKESGYEVAKCQPLDMFPHTPHIENVILMSI
jgi:23S rRNA (uracil-5-)-methyltransferase RumA